MSKQNIQLVIIIAIIMFGILKSMFTTNDNSGLKEAIKNGQFLVDVRTPSEFSTASVKGAINIPLDKLPSQLDKFKNKKGIVVFCKSGNRSSQAKKILEQNGFKNVINGGTWQNVQQIVNE
jgi:phage shock protein E